jgi:hypothetical protein
MGRGRWIGVVAALLLVGGVLAFWFLVYKPFHEHRRWYNQVRVDLYALADKRPADVPPGQWEFMVGWTLHLHSNWGASHTWVDRDQMWPFLEELERRLQGPVSIGTIDWIWDEYARITKGGREYGERYRPTQSPDLQYAQPGCFLIWVK